VVEVWNGTWRSDVPWQADNEAAPAEWGHGLAADLRGGRWRPAIGNSDAHLEGQIGTPQTVVLAASLEPPALLAGLRGGTRWQRSAAQEMNRGATRSRMLSSTASAAHAAASAMSRRSMPNSRR